MATVAVMQNSPYLCSRKPHRKYLMPPRGGHNRGDQNSMTRVTNNQPYEHTFL